VWNLLASRSCGAGWSDLKQVTYDPGQMLEHNWIFERNPDPVLWLHDHVLHQVSSLGLAMIGLTFACVLVCWLRGRLPGGRHWWLPQALIPLAVLVLLFPVSHLVWNTLPEFRFLQFPWRWLLTIEAPMGVFFAAAVWPGSRRAESL